MSKPIVVQTCWMPEAFIQKAAEAGKIELRLWKPQEGERRMTAPQEWIKEHIQGASALMCTPMNKVSEEIFEAAGPSLKVVSTMSVGFEHIDREAAKKRGIRVGYTPDVLSPAVADVGLLLALNVMRHVLDGMNTVKTGTWLKKPWSPLSFCGPALEDKTVGFIGFGSIAQALVLKLLPFKPGKIVYRTSKPRAFDIKDDYFRFLLQDDMLRCYYHCHQRLPVPVENEPDLKALAEQCDVILYVYTTYTQPHFYAKCVNAPPCGCSVFACDEAVGLPGEHWPRSARRYAGSRGSTAQERDCWCGSRRAGRRAKHFR